MAGPFGTRRLPLTCLVTDRRRWSADGGETARPGMANSRVGWDLLLDRVRVAGRAGIDLVQVREPDLEARDLFELVVACVENTRETDTLVVVNERADVARSAGAHGVHLRASSLSAVILREIVPPGFLIGRSVHGLADLQRGESRGVDYLIAGTVFASGSKPPGQPLLAMSELTAIVNAADVPVLAIGGITRENVTALAAAGVAGVGGIGVFGEATRSETAARTLLERFREGFAARR
jgi:thiamine-phosphate pyrophosphorylase